MPIEKVDGFYQSTDLSHTPCLGIESKNIDNCLIKIKESKIRGVFGSHSYGFNEDNLEFLNGLDWVETVWLWDIALKNIDMLYKLKNLKHFGIHPKRPPIDFSSFSLLEKAVIQPKAKDKGLENLRNLEQLHIWHYKPNLKTFENLYLPQSIKELHLNWVNPKSLKTLQPIKSLQALEIHCSRNMIELGDLSLKYPLIERLSVSSCNSLSQGVIRQSVDACENIKSVFLNDQCILKNA